MHNVKKTYLGVIAVSLKFPITCMITNSQIKLLINFQLHYIKSSTTRNFNNDQSMVIVLKSNLIA